MPAAGFISGLGRCPLHPPHQQPNSLVWLGWDGQVCYRYPTLLVKFVLGDFR
jgi:hypothetical protein